MVVTRAAKAREASESDLEMFRTPRTTLTSPPSQSSSKTVTPPSPGYVCTICRNSEDLRNILVNKTYSGCDETVNLFDSILHETKVSLESITSFHKIIYESVPISLPDYIEPYTGQGRLRQANLDSLSYVCTFTHTHHVDPHFTSHSFTE